MPQKETCVCEVATPPHPLPRRTTFCFLSLWFACSGISHDWSHTLHDLLCLASLTQHVLQVHSCCGMCPGLFLFMASYESTVWVDQFVNGVAVIGPAGFSHLVAVANGDAMNIH